MMALCDLPMLRSDYLVKQYPTPEEWSPQLTCNLISDKIQETSVCTSYDFVIHGAVLINLYLAYVFMMKCIMMLDTNVNF
jgi:hypothetical protein